jgi:hypothetical protein
MPSRKTVAKKPVTKKVAPKATRAVAKKTKTTVKTTAKATKMITKKAPVKKAPVKKAPVKKAPAIKAADSSQSAHSAVELLENKASEKGESIESLITRRDVQLKSVEEYMGLQHKQDMSGRPIIPGLFDLLIPPGTPRKMVLNLAKKYGLEIVRRDDIYVPVGVCDIERDLLAIRGDKKTITKMEKILYEEINKYIESKDARRHDYSKTPRLEGIGVNAAPSKKARSSSK